MQDVEVAAAVVDLVRGRSDLQTDESDAFDVGKRRERLQWDRAAAAFRVFNVARPAYTDLQPANDRETLPPYRRRLLTNANRQQTRRNCLFRYIEQGRKRHQADIAVGGIRLVAVCDGLRDTGQTAEEVNQVGSALEYH